MSVCHRPSTGPSPAVPLSAADRTTGDGGGRRGAGGAAGWRRGSATTPPGRTEDVVQSRLHTELARRRVYVHPVRWTSLGLSLLEAMHLGMPVVALATTEVPEAVPPGAGVVSHRVDVLTDAVGDFLADPGHARAVGERARAAAVSRYGLPRFLDDWERLLKEVTR